MGNHFHLQGTSPNPYLSFKMISKRICLALDLIDDPELIAAYTHYHQPPNVPPAILRSIHDAGIVDMEIYLTGNRLFMIMEVNETFDPATKAKMDADNPDVQAWETLMWKFQQALPWAQPGEKWIEMERIFKLA